MIAPLVCLFIAGLLLAPQAGGQEEPEVRRSFSVVALGGAVRDLYFESAEGEERELRAFPRRRTDGFDYSGNRDLVFYRKNTGADGLPVRTPAGRFRFTGETSDWLLFLSPDQGNGYRVFGFPADSLPPDRAGFQFVNLSSVPVAGLLGSEVFSLPPGGSETLAAEELQAGGESQVVKLALRRESDWDLFYETFWPERKDERWVVLIHPDERDRMQVVRIKEKVGG